MSQGASEQHGPIAGDSRPSPAPAEESARRTLSPEITAQLRPITVLIVVLAVLGAVLGVVWAWWSPPVPMGVNLQGGLERQESKAFVSADARFVILVVVVGVLAAVAAWFVRRARGAPMALGLAVGGLLGAWLTGAVGNTVGGGTDEAPVNKVIPHLELHVQMTGSYYFEAAVALLIYSLLVAFAAEDDLGHPDQARLAAHERRNAAKASDLVSAQGGVQDARGDGNGPGLSQQHDFPTQ